MLLGFDEDSAGGKQAKIQPGICRAGNRISSLTLEMISVFPIHFEFSTHSCQSDSFVSVDFVAGNYFTHIFSMKMGN